MADLHGANLREALLIETNLSQAHLSGADLTRAKPDETVFGDTDLTDVKGLDSWIHQGPSTIDHRTLMKSGQLPLQFLRGCELTDWQIEAVKFNQPDLEPGEVTDTLYRIMDLRVTQPLRFYSCFISYSTNDQEFADRLYADLQNKGARCWFAREDLKIGDKFRVRIDESIRIYDKLLLILSEHSIASDWVEKEVETAMEKEREEKRTVLFPVRLDDAVMANKTG